MFGSPSSSVSFRGRNLFLSHPISKAHGWVETARNFPGSVTDKTQGQGQTLPVSWEQRTRSSYVVPCVPLTGSSISCEWNFLILNKKEIGGLI